MLPVVLDMCVLHSIYTSASCVQSFALRVVLRLNSRYHCLGVLYHHFIHCTYASSIVSAVLRSTDSRLDDRSIILINVH